jgi:hypothetical protein
LHGVKKQDVKQAERVVAFAVRGYGFNARLVLVELIVVNRGSEDVTNRLFV